MKRPPRALPSEVSTQEIILQSPPELPRGHQESVLMQLLPTLGMGGSVVFFFTSGQPFMRIMGMVMIASTVAMAIAMVVRFRRGSQGELADMRRDYLSYLAQTRRTALDTAKAQRDAQYFLHPSPEQLWALVAEGSRVWERRPGDEDFAQVRIGLGAQALATPWSPPRPRRSTQLEPLTAGAMQRFLAVHGTLDDLPMAVSLRAFYHVTISGDPESVRSSARAMAGSLAALHSPEDLVIVGRRGPRGRAPLGVGQVAAARPGARRGGRRGQPPADRRRLPRAGGPARRPADGPSPLPPERGARCRTSRTSSSYSTASRCRRTRCWPTPRDCRA